MEDAKELAGHNIVMVLVGNKIDCEPTARQVSFMEASQYAQQKEISTLVQYCLHC